jgi:hypothetical protein
VCGCVCGWLLTTTIPVPVRFLLLPPTAAQESVAACKQEWSGVQSEFTKRFDTQLKQELQDQGSSITGVLGLCTSHMRCELVSRYLLGGGRGGQGQVPFSRSCRTKAQASQV